MSEFTTCALFLSESIGNYTHRILFISTFHKGYSVYADGFVEQWFRPNTVTSDQEKTITFSIVVNAIIFASNNLCGTASLNPSPTINNRVQIGELSTSQCKIVMSTLGNVIQVLGY